MTNPRDASWSVLNTSRTRTPPQLVAGFLVVVLLVLGACGSSDLSRGSARDPSQVLEGADVLPFGLEVVEGTAPIGRPAIWTEQGTRLRAAYRVIDGDPVGAFQQWVDQLRRFIGDRWEVTSDDGPDELWLSAENDLDDPPGDHAEVELWATSGDPILLVSVRSTRREPDPLPQPAPVEDDATKAPPPTVVVEDVDRERGDALFEEQGDVVHLPEGSEPLMPTLPTWSGTGGSTSLLAAADPEVAIQEMLEEARAYTEPSDLPDVNSLETTVYDDVQVGQASFLIPAGGWFFDVMVVRGADDAYATIYVLSGAD